MSRPLFDIAVEPMTGTSLRVVLAGDSGQWHEFAVSILGWFGDEYLASPQLDDLLHLTVCRVGDPNPVFDSARDGFEPLCRPGELLRARPRPSAAPTTDQHTIELVVLESSAVVDAPAPATGDGRLVWLVGDDSFDLLPGVHKQWSARRTVADGAADGLLLRDVCAELVRAAKEGPAPTPTEWVESEAVSRLLGGTGYAVG